MTHDTTTDAVGKRELRGVLAGVMLGMLVAALAQTIVATALPTIVGELRRHFRDRTWSLKVPRSCKDLRPLVFGAREQLEQQWGRPATVEEIAEFTELDLADVEPMNQPYPLVNVLRDDVEVDVLDRAAVLAEAPDADTASGRFRVPPIGTPA